MIWVQPNKAQQNHLHLGLVTTYGDIDLVKIMVCYLTTSSRYPNQSWLIISEVLWAVSQWISKPLICMMNLKVKPRLPGASGLMRYTANCRNGYLILPTIPGVFVTNFKRSEQKRQSESKKCFLCTINAEAMPQNNIGCERYIPVYPDDHAKLSLLQTIIT